MAATSHTESRRSTKMAATINLAEPNLEPSHIYHFKGLVARCSTFSGVGTDHMGNRIAFGSPTTDFGLMQGDYWAARAGQHGVFATI
jgi:hypothetical protein